MNPPGATPDIRLTKNNSVGVFKGLTEAGKQWLRLKIKQDPVMVQIDYVDELREEIELDGLRVEY